MKESFKSRVNRLISGSINSFIDTLEHMAPEMVMDEAIREINGAIGEIRVEIGRLIATEHFTRTRLAEDAAQRQLLDDNITLALEHGREDLAEAAIAKQMDGEAREQAFRDTLNRCAQQAQELKDLHSALEQKKQSLANELAAFQKSRPAPGGYPLHRGKPLSASVDNAESAFRRVLDRHSAAPTVSFPGETPESVRLAQLDQLGRKEAIKKRLAQLKAQHE